MHLCRMQCDSLAQLCELSVNCTGQDLVILFTGKTITIKTITKMGICSHCNGDQIWQRQNGQHALQLLMYYTYDVIVTPSRSVPASNFEL